MDRETFRRLDRLGEFLLQYGNLIERSGLVSIQDMNEVLSFLGKFYLPMHTLPSIPVDVVKRCLDAQEIWLDQKLK